MWPQNNSRIKLVVVASIVLLVISRIMSAIFPLFLKQTIDFLGSDNWQEKLYYPLWLLVAYGGVRIVSQVFSDIKDALFVYVEHFATKKIALQVFSKIHQLSLGFHLMKKTGGLSRSIERGVSSIEMLMRFLVFSIGPVLMEMVFVFGILFYFYEWYFPVIVAVTIILYIAYTVLVTRWRISLIRLVNTNETQTNATSVDSIMNYETVKYFCREEEELAKYDRNFSKYLSASFKNRTSLAVLNIGQGIIIAIGMTLTLILAVIKIKEGVMSIGDLVLVNLYIVQLYIPLNNLGFAYRQIKLSLVNMEEMFDILKANLVIKDKLDIPELMLSKGDIAFEGVDFSYNPKRSILHQISFNIKGGQRVAIVGPSGCGKSTISRLLFRFYEPNKGAILIDGQDICKVTQKSLRQVIGVVPQDTVLFNDSIYNNVAYANPKATRAQVINVCKISLLHDFVKTLPQGYDTVVGERGLKLSGGEKQRLSLARMILKDPQIFVFDEATSALDSNSEKAVITNLGKVLHKKTSIIIAHRLSTIVDCDNIIVVDHGRVVESGTHAQLLKNAGLYNKLWQKQQAKGEK